MPRKWSACAYSGKSRTSDAALALSISGEAEDPPAFKALNIAMKSGMPKGIQLASAQIRAPAISPFTWSAQLAGGQLVVAGYVSAGARQSLTQAAKAITGKHVSGPRFFGLFGESAEA